MVVSMTDLTTLEGHGLAGQGAAACARRHACTLCPVNAEIGAARRRPSASTPTSSPWRVDALRDSGRAGRVRSRPAFPAGRATDLDVKVVEDTRRAVGDGGDQEIDMVIDRGAFLAGQLRQGVRRGVSASRRPVATLTSRSSSRSVNCAPTTTSGVRVRIAILGRCGLHQDEHRQGVKPASTTMPVVLLMLESRCAITTSRLAGIVGVKAAGGIRSAKDALRYLVHGQRDLWRSSGSRPHLVPIRRELAAQRRADAATCVSTAAPTSGPRTSARTERW